MSDWTRGPFLEALPTVHVCSLESIGQGLIGIGQLLATGAGSAVWQTINRAVFIPFWNLGQRDIVAQRLWWLNGTAVSGNVDMGLYDAKFVRLVSTGSTAQAGVSVLQAVAITPLALAPGGPYYFALACDNVVATFGRFSVTATALTMLGCANANTAFPLPPAPTRNAQVGASLAPIMGLSQRSFP